MEKRHEHGTRASYSAGCRCRLCKSAWATYLRIYKHSRGTHQPLVAYHVDREIAQGEQRLAEVVNAEEEAAAVNVVLSPLALHILLELQRKTRKRRGDILDQFLRNCGAELLDAAAAA